MTQTHPKKTSTWQGLHQVMRQHSAIAFARDVDTWVIDAQNCTDGLETKGGYRQVTMGSNTKQYGLIVLDGLGVHVF